MLFCTIADPPHRETKLERLYDAYKDLMFYEANRILRNREDAQDAVQMAFEALLRNQHKISQVDSPKTRAFVVIVVERKAIDILRQRNRRAEIPFEEDYQSPISPPGDGSLADAMARLPASYRDALILKYHVGLNNRELSDILGVTQSGVRKLLSRAKAKLREELRQEEIDV